MPTTVSISMRVKRILHMEKPPLRISKHGFRHPGRICGRHLPKHKAQKESNQVITYINIDSYIIASTFVTTPPQKPHRSKSRTAAKAAPPQKPHRRKSPTAAKAPPQQKPHHRTTTAPPQRPPQRPPSDIRHRGNDFDDFVSVDLKNCGGGASWGGRSGGIPHVIPPDRPPQEIPSIQRTYARAHDPSERGDWRRVHMKMQDCRQCTTMTEHGEREASVCLPCAVHCTTTTECGCGDRGYLDAGRTLDHASRTRREGASPLLPRGCIPSSPAFLHRVENGHFLLIPHIPQKGSFDSLNLERHLTFRLSSPTGRFFSCFSCRAERFSLFCA